MRVQDIIELDISDLPPALLKELSLKMRGADRDLLAALQKLSSPCTLDHLLVQIYRDTGAVLKRVKLNARLYRAIKSGDVISPTRGVYHLSEKGVQNVRD